MPSPRLLFVLVRSLAGLAGVVLGGSCIEESQGVPLTEPLFPTGVAVVDDRLLVVSSDFDLAQNAGALLTADLAAVRADIAPEGVVDVVLGAYSGGAVMPPFGDRPVVTSGGERVYVPTRGTNRVVVFDVAQDGTLSCGDAPTVLDGAAAGAPSCGENSNTLQLTANDPFYVLILEETREGDALVRVDGITTLQSSPDIVFFSDDTRRPGAARVQRGATINLGETIGGVRSAVLRPAVAGTDPVVIAATDLSRDLSLFGARVLLFQPAVDSEIRSFDVSLATGSLSMRDMVLVPGEDGENDALIAVLRQPDALVRFEIEEAGAVPDLRMSVVRSTCRAPQALAHVVVPSSAGDVERVLLTCHDDDAIEALDPLTLQTTDAVRFLGRGPYGVVVNAAVEPVEVYVSFFLDGSIGVLRFLEDADGQPRLTADGRIGAALPRPEDGRE